MAVSGIHFLHCHFLVFVAGSPFLPYVILPALSSFSLRCVHLISFSFFRPIPLQQPLQLPCKEVALPTFLVMYFLFLLVVGALAFCLHFWVLPLAAHITIGMTSHNCFYPTFARYFNVFILLAKLVEFGFLLFVCLVKEKGYFCLTSLIVCWLVL